MAEPILRAEGLTMKDGGAADLASVSFAVERGALAAVIGPDAWDKDALVALLAARRPASQGTLRFQGRPITALTGAARRRRGLSWTLRPPLAFATGTLVEAVALAMAAPRPARPFDAFRRRPSPASAAAAVEILRFTGLGARADGRPARLERAERARLELARCLAADPKLVVVDRLTAALAPGERTALARLLRQLTRGGLSVLWVEDDAALALDHADQVVALNHGRTLTAGALDAPTRADALEAAFLGQPR
jgi:ABC-type branched-subunit amino acid transport system ATPase component